MLREEMQQVREIAREAVADGLMKAKWDLEDLIKRVHALEKDLQALREKTDVLIEEAKSATRPYRSSRKAEE